MTAPAPSAIAETSAPMPRTTSPEQPAAPAGRAAADAGATAGRRALRQLSDNPLQALFGSRRKDPRPQPSDIAPRRPPVI